MPPRKERPLVVLDTNVLISAALTPKPVAAREVVMLWKRGFLQLVLSEAIMHEYLLVLGRFDLSERQMQSWARWFAHPSKTVHLVEARLVKESHDPKDDPFLGAAATAGAEWILSRDEDLLVLQEFEGIPIVTPAAFLAERRATSESRKKKRR
jgi:putative PIN family toxin of toxin-antitoxin system